MLHSDILSAWSMGHLLKENKKKKTKEKRRQRPIPPFQKKCKIRS
jgi:hypothetical protein